MQENDIRFFDEYKQLDKLCREMYSSSDGVSEYLSRMERKNHGQYMVSSWNKDYKLLKHLKWIRNQIAHETSGNATEDDVAAVIDFHYRIMHQQDPLALLFLAEKVKKEAKPDVKPVVTRNPEYSVNQTVPNYMPITQSTNPHIPIQQVRKQSRKKHSAGRIICLLLFLIISGIVSFAIIAPDKLLDVIHGCAFLEKTFSAISEWLLDFWHTAG